MTQPHEGILLLGPTGSGKTPLGQTLAQRGLQSRPCFHFDFGANLRRLAALSEPDVVASTSDIAFIRRILASGALLEDKDFPIAQRVLQSFLAARHVMPDDWVVLNGLPRHIGQATAIESIVCISTVIVLRCDAETVWQRITDNPGGDRTDRTDDDRAAVEQKLAMYAQRTRPLIDFYRGRNVRLIQLDVSATMTPEQAWELVADRAHQ